MITTQWKSPWVKTGIGYGMIGGNLTAEKGNRELSDIIGRFEDWHIRRKRWSRYATMQRVAQWIMPFGYYIPFTMRTKVSHWTVQREPREPWFRVSRPWTIMSFFFKGDQGYAETRFYYAFLYPRKRWKAISYGQAVHYVEQCGGRVIE